MNDNLSPFASVIAALIRALLMFTFGYFVNKKILTNDQVSAIALPIAGALITLAVALWTRYKQVVMTHLALNMPAGTSPLELKAAYAEGKQNDPPPVRADGVVNDEMLETELPTKDLIK